nr:MAG TPA: hypothetical protein [Caudoviricetes sp.]
MLFLDITMSSYNFILECYLYYIPRKKRGQ